MKPFDTAWLVLKNFVLEPEKAAGYFNRKTGKVNLNLANPFFHLRGDPSNDAEGFAEELVIPVTEHEYTHALIDEELKEAIRDRVLPQDRYITAHEIGANALGGAQSLHASPYRANAEADMATRFHPKVMSRYPEGTFPFFGMGNTGSFQPKPIVSDDLPYEFPERYPGQARQTFHSEEDFE